MAVAHAVLLAVAHGELPGLLAGRDQIGGHGGSTVDGVGRVAMHAQHVEHVDLVVGESGERTHAAGRARAGGVRVAGHERGERRRPRPALDRVVRQAERHQQRAEVRVADAELAELAAGFADRLGGVIGAADEDLLGGEDDLDGVHVGLDVEAVVTHRIEIEVLQQVDRGQVASRVVEMHVLAAVAHDHTVGHVAVVARLAQVVGQLDTVIGA